jgi:UDP-galactopyranose mutase
MPALDVLGLSDPLGCDRFGVVQDFVLHVVLIQTIDELFRYLHGHLRWKNITFHHLHYSKEWSVLQPNR